jgi:hypothetical protein
MHDHDDFGGLREDLHLTGAALGRRDLLRLAFGAGVLTLFGCGDSGLTGSEDAPASRRRRRDRIRAMDRTARTRSRRPASCEAASARASWG